MCARSQNDSGPETYWNISIAYNIFPTAPVMPSIPTPSCRRLNTLHAIASSQLSNKPDRALRSNPATTRSTSLSPSTARVQQQMRLEEILIDLVE